MLISLFIFMPARQTAVATAINRSPRMNGYLIILLDLIHGVQNTATVNQTFTISE